MSNILSVLSVIMFIIAIVFVIALKKFVKGEMKKLDKKIRDLNDSIDSANEMVMELNGISDYIVEIVNNKTSDAEELVKKLDEQIKVRKNIINEQIFQENINRKIVDVTKNIKLNTQAEKASNKDISYSKLSSYSKNIIKNTENKAPALNTRDRILELYSQGHTDAEIAKILSLGRGEVQLYLGIRNGTE